MTALAARRRHASENLPLSQVLSFWRLRPAPRSFCRVPIGRSERSNLGSCGRAMSTCHKRRTRRRTSRFALPWDVDFATASAAPDKVVASSSLFEPLVLVPDDPANQSLDHSHLLSSRRPRARNLISIHQAGRPEQFDPSAHLMPDTRPSSSTSECRSTTRRRRKHAPRSNASERPAAPRTRR